MKNISKTKQKNDKVKRKPVAKPKKEKVLIVAQEIKFARLLSGNEKKTRDRVLKSLKKWLLNCFEKNHQFKEEDFLRVWKGLFYAVWMSDKPLVQEELCDNISGILDMFPPEHIAEAMLMMKAGFRVLATEWFGIDQHRMDKFLMLVRRYLRAGFRCLQRCEWSDHACQLFADTLQGKDGLLAYETPLFARNAMSMVLHIIECYIEELAKVCRGVCPGASLAAVVSPLCARVCSARRVEVSSACRRALTALARHADPARIAEHKQRVWEKMGCPGGGPDDLELVSDDDEEKQSDDEEANSDDDDTLALDPRAGRVDVRVRVLRVRDAAPHLVRRLAALLPRAASADHKRLRLCIQRFEAISADENPLPLPACSSLETSSRESRASLARRRAASLQELDTKLLADSDELALRGLSRKHRKRLLSRCRAGHNIADEMQDIKKTKHNNNRQDKNSTDGAWQVEETEPPPPKKQKTKEDSSNKENVVKKKKTKKQANTDATTDQQNNPIKTSKNTEIIYEKKAKKNDMKTNATENDEKKEKKHVKLVFKESPKKKNTKPPKQEKTNEAKQPVLVVNKTKNFQKKTSPETVDKDQQQKPQQQKQKSENIGFSTPKKVKFVLKKNSMQGTVDYYKSVRQSPNIPFDGKKRPTKTNLKPFTPSPINPFKKKMRLRNKSFA